MAGLKGTNNLAGPADGPVTWFELMKTFSIRTLLVLMAIAALIVWWSVPRFRMIHQETSPGHGEILISIKQEWMSGQYKMRIKYIPTGAQPDEIHLSNTILLGTDQLDQLEFQSLIDDETGLWCLYDTVDKNVVILVSPTGVDYRIWHPGVHIGWARGIWINYFKTIKKAHAEIPYDRLPTEMRTESK